MTRFGLTALLLQIAGCASIPRPAILTEVDNVREQPGTRDLRTLVPQAEARAEKLRNDAEAAWSKGQIATSEILGEHALITYTDLQKFEHILRTEQHLLATKTELHQAELELLKLEAEQKKSASEAADLEAQLRVEREAESIADPKPATPDREQARLIAAKTALAQAKLLCISAQLLQSPNEVMTALSELDAVEAKVTSAKPPAPIREAIAVRSRCQQLLTAVRRPAQIANPTSSKPDELFVALAQAGFAPARDDRGIVVTLTDAFTGNGIDPKTRPRLLELGRVAEGHGETPLLLVVHSQKGEAKPIDQQRSDAAAAQLREAGAKRVQNQTVGARLPVAQATDLGAAKRNERLEIIFVTAQ